MSRNQPRKITCDPTEPATTTVHNDVAERYAVKTTAHIDALATKSEAVARQYQPDIRELTTLSDELPDPIGDEAHSPAKGIIHRHPDRVLLKPVHACAVYCRFCFRREMVGPGKEFLNTEDLGSALDYIRTRTEIWEVIITGGDPLILSPRRLAALLDALCSINHIQVIRIHTRLPLADPERITKTLCDVIKNADKSKAVYIALHVNHADELSCPVRAAIKALHETGATLVSQSVLLRGINDNAETLADLFKTLVFLHVKPYYLHHPDKAPGTSHFRVPIAAGQKLVKALRARISGLCQPTYMLDIPQGYGKVPLTPCYLTETDTEDKYKVEDPSGKLHDYV